MIANPHAEHGEIVDLVQRRLTGFITAKDFVMIVYNVSNDIFDKAVAITPGKRSPTVTSLDNAEMKSVSALVAKKQLNEVMDQLHEIGATDILAMDISNSRM